MMRGLRDMLRQEGQMNREPKEKEKSTIKAKQWLNGLKHHNSLQIKQQVLEFFIAEGHFDVAQIFAKESGIEMPKVNEEEIKKRFLIKKLISENKIDEAIRQINLMKENVLLEKENKELLFSLKCLKVINLIKTQQIQESIRIAKKELLPFAKQNTEYLEKIEKIMSLIAFIDEKECSNYELTTQHHRDKVGAEVNKLLLGKEQKGEGLIMLLNLAKWCEKRLEKHVNFPKINLLGHDLFLNPDQK